MAINVKLSETLVESAKRYAAIEHRSVPKQIEYRSQIGKIAAENPVHGHPSHSLRPVDCANFM